ncbi:MAG TPA: hypothetical protein VIF15_13965 [Polyangiaceae bacterium]|jgi:hypothetical protein
MLRRTHLAVLVALGLALATPFAARAQGTSEAAATALFDDGRKLMDQKRYAEACPKLAESERLAPSGGTLINLAECYEHTGQTASAWVSWKDAAARANAAGKADVEKRALGRAAALEPTLAKLTIAVDQGSDVAGLVVKRDGVDVGHAEFGVPIPVDPGAHVVEATAPKKLAYSTKVDVAARQTDARATVSLADDPAATTAATVAPPPPLPPAPTTAATTPDEPPPAQGGSTQKTIALVVGGVGVVGVAVGAVFGLNAKSKNDQALQNCRTSTLCTAQGLSLTDDAKSAATISTVAFAAGGAALAAGVVLWLTAPSSHASTGLRVAPVVARSYGGVALDAAW